MVCASGFSFKPRRCSDASLFALVAASSTHSVARHGAARVRVWHRTGVPAKAAVREWAIPPTRGLSLVRVTWRGRTTHDGATRCVCVYVWQHSCYKRRLCVAHMLGRFGAGPPGQLLGVKLVRPVWLLCGRGRGRGCSCASLLQGDLFWEAPHAGSARGDSRSGERQHSGAYLVAQ
jgi:hypothetical protein